MFKLHCKDVNENMVTLLYDPHKGIMTDILGNKMKVENPESFKSPISKNNICEFKDAIRFNPSNPIGKSNEIKHLKIQMGLGCNYSCSYCSQSIHLKNGEAFITNAEDAKKFLANLDSWLEGEPQKIEFWGGEPFVYWNTLQILVDDLGKRFPNTMLTIITNGSLLDDEKFEWVMSNGIGLAVSHDGPGQHLRGPDPLEENSIRSVWQKFVDVLSPIGQISFNTVLTKNNCDVKKIREWFVQRLGDKVITNFEGVVTIHDDTTREYGNALFSDENYVVMQQSIYEMIVTGTGAKNPTILHKIRDFINSISSNRPSTALGQKCGMDKESSIAVDLQGNAMTCQNIGANGRHKIGNVSNFAEISLNTSWHWSNRESCNNCPVLQICKGSCMYLEGDDFVDTCNNEYAYSLPYLAGVLYLLWGFKLNHIEGDIRRPQKSKEN